jgi:hypothetical protein
MKKTAIKLIITVFILMVFNNSSFSEESTGSKEPTFFFYNKAQLNHYLNIDEKYINNLLSKMGEKLKEGQPLSVPVSLIEGDVLPVFGQEIWGFIYSDEHGLYVFPDQVDTVTGFQIQGDDLNGNSISFQTNHSVNISNMGAVYVLGPKDVSIESERASSLSLNEINELISRLPETYMPVNEKIKNPLNLNKDELLKNDLKLAIKIGNYKVIEFIKVNTDGSDEKVCFIDLGKKIVVFHNSLFLNILKIGDNDYFIVDDTNWYVGQLSVYKLIGENFTLIKSDGFSKD